MESFNISRGVSMKIIAIGMLASISFFILTVSIDNARHRNNTKAQADKTDLKQKKAVEAGFEFAGNLEYIKDNRTGLCFAYMWHGSGFGGPVFSQVPCTKEVESLVEKGLTQRH